MTNELIMNNQLPTAIFAASDPIAIGALRALKEHHIKVPEDISLMGFDNIETTNYTDPPLTTQFLHQHLIWDIWEQDIFLMPIIDMKTYLL